MKKTKSILVAAGVSLALALTLSCSGDDGRDGKDGTSCEIRPSVSEEGDYEIFCGGLSVGYLNNGASGSQGATGPAGSQGSQGLQGPQGPAGSQGSQGPQGNAGNSCKAVDKITHVEIQCGSDTPIEMPKVEWCGTTPYNPATHFCDGRDKQAYKYVTIGTQVWLAQNLNFNASGSVCNNNDSDNCDTYGRLYNWATAMALDPSCNANTCLEEVQAKHKGICPAGWHIPNDDEWDILTKYVDPNWISNSNNVAGTRLKAISGWNYHATHGNGTDDFGFSALPGGIGWNGNFQAVGGGSRWWSASEDSSTGALARYMDNNHSYVGRLSGTKTGLFSVRCVRGE